MTGIILACTAVVLASAAPILAKAATKRTDPALAGGVCGLVFCITLFFYKRTEIKGFSYASIGQTTWLFVLLIGAIAGLFGICFFRALHFGEVSAVLPIERCSYAITFVACVFLFHNKMRIVDYVILALMVVGVIIVSMYSKSKNNSYILFAILSALLLSTASIIAKLKIAGLSDTICCFTTSIIGVIVIIVFGFASSAAKKLRSMSFLDGVYLVAAGIAYPAAYDFYNKSLALIGKVAGYIFDMTLLLVLLAASIVLKEKISGKKLVGVLMFVAALLLIQYF